MVSLEPPLYAWVQAQADDRGVSLSQYLRDLAARERDHIAKMMSDREAMFEAMRLYLLEHGIEPPDRRH